MVKEDYIILNVCNKSLRSIRGGYTLPIPLKRDRTSLGPLFVKLGFKRGAEIGVYKGEFSKVLCDAISGLELYCIDCYERPRYARREKLAHTTLLPYNATFIKKFSMDALADFADGSLDFVYIDAAHDFDNACMDIICWSKKVKPNGIVACHDYYYFTNSGVVKAVDAYTHCHHIDPWYVTTEVTATAFWVNP